MATWKDLEKTLVDSLDLKSPPVAVAFLAAPPAGVRRFMGQVPSGCGFWSLAARAPAGKSAFYTVPSDHYNCPIGSYTHHIELPPERAQELEGVLGLMVEIGYLKMEEVPQIPRWPAQPAAVVYARLADTPVPPDAVLVAAPARATMLLGEASRAAGKSSALPALPRPTCMAIPAAAAHGTTMSLACIGNRIYTGLDDGDLYSFVRGADLEAVVSALPTIVSANAKLTAYHNQRKPQLTRPDLTA
ncbi:MAG TPA: DUF169 domain-containing protein [Polyangia bacterium]|nr:DUF169 domain-containing protein [Polyangia bacterium]